MMVYVLLYLVRLDRCISSVKHGRQRSCCST